MDAEPSEVGSAGRGPATRWQTLKGWHGQESFWREVYARTVAGVFTAATVFVAAVAAGYVQVHRRQAVAAIAFVAGGVPCFLLDRRRNRGGSIAWWEYLLLALSTLLVALLGVWAIRS